MRAVVIGGSGLIGAALARVLEREGIDVTATFCTRPLSPGQRLDATDAAAVDRLVRAVRPNVVFWAARPAAHPGHSDGELQGVRNVVAATASHSIRLVYVSSDEVFDGEDGPYHEDTTPSPVTDAGRAKAAAEAHVLTASSEALVIRTSAVFGWDRRSRNIAMAISERLSKGGTLELPADEWTTPTFAEYLAEATVRLVQINAAGVVNVAGGETTTTADLGRALARAMGLGADGIEPISQAARRGLDTTKMSRLLGTPPPTLQDSVRQFRRAWRADSLVKHQPLPVAPEAAALKQEIFAKVRDYHALAHRPQPFVPFKSRVQYSGRVFGAEEIVSLVDSALDFWLTLGPYGELFEQRMRKYLGVSDFVLMNSGSTANLAAVLAVTATSADAPLCAGDEVITPAVTFPTTLAPLVHGGLVPVFVDCEVGTYNINPALVEAAISDRTRAIMIPHTLGVPCDMDVIGDVAKRHELVLIEDCCDALGATFRGRPVGTYGALATVSFFPAHQMTMGEGGGVIVNTPRLAKIVRSVRDWGRDCWCATGESNTCGKRFGWQAGELPRGYDHKYIYSNLGYNFKPTDLQAAVGIAQLDRLPGFIAARRRNFEQLYAALAGYQEHLVLPRRDARAAPSWFGFPITVAHGIERQDLVHWLETANIETRQLFGGNILRQPAYLNIRRRVHGELTESDRIMRDTFFVGVYPGLTEEMVSFIGSRIRDFFDTGQWKRR